jgi:hypothetical protein
MRRGHIVGRYVSALMEGDAVALGITAVFLFFVVVVVIVALKTRAAHRREDEQRKNKWLKKK